MIPIALLKRFPLSSDRSPMGDYGVNRNFYRGLWFYAFHYNDFCRTPQLETGNAYIFKREMFVFLKDRVKEKVIE
jgi:hypothetical protein